MADVLNYILLRNFRAKRVREKFLDSIGSEFAEESLELLLRLMRLFFFIDRDFKRNIQDFNGRYLFRSKDNKITVAAIFENDQLKVYEKSIHNTDVTVSFRNYKVLMNYLLSPKPDILGSILRQDVVIDGSFNYLFKFAYMAKHLQLIVTGQA